MTLLRSSPAYGVRPRRPQYTACDAPSMGTTRSQETRIQGEVPEDAKERGMRCTREKHHAATGGWKGNDATCAPHQPKASHEP